MNINPLFISLLLLFEPITSLCSAQRVTVPILEYSHKSESIVIQVDYARTTSPGTNHQPYLRIYGDGRIRVEPFPYEKDKGHREMHLQEQDVRELLRYLYDLGLMETSAENIKEKKAEVLQSRHRQSQLRGQPALESHISDATTFVIEIFLNRYQPIGAARPTENYHYQMGWYALRDDTKEFPEVRELALLSHIEMLMIQYANHPDLMKIDL